MNQKRKEEPDGSALRLDGSELHSACSYPQGYHISGDVITEKLLCSIHCQTILEHE